MTSTRRVAALAVTLVGVSAGAVSAQALQEGFPHAEHEGLFPLQCTACHRDIEEGTTAHLYPEPQECETCHDGTVEERVGWQGPAQRRDNLDFDHGDHFRATRRAGDDDACATCHATEGATDPMDVAGARPEACLSCHAHEAPEHLAPGRDCAVCHVPLTRARDLRTEDIEAFPSPPSHEAPDFQTDHSGPASDGTCAVCHARESCSRCHVNGDDVDAIRLLERDPRVAELQAEAEPEYPTPATHDGMEWDWKHADAASDGAGECANCHTRRSCAACHVRPGAGPLTALPTVRDGDPRGVHLPTSLPAHRSGWALEHGVAGASGEACRSCHADDFCESCHEAQAAPAFHLGNFLAAHGAEAYHAETECVSCHNPEVFCRACHSGLGLASRGQLSQAFHSSDPFWLLGHGKAARQGLQGCVTCHAQTDCTRCHAAVGGWGITPHGPGFDAARMKEVAPMSCIPCHRGGGPGS